jgi:hypothetical protein
MPAGSNLAKKKRAIRRQPWRALSYWTKVVMLCAGSVAVKVLSVKLTALNAATLVLAVVW